METEKLRLDKYLWAIRVFKTRTQAAKAIDSGKVKFNGAEVKSSRSVNVGDQYQIKAEQRKWIIAVTNLLYKRVQYEEALKYYNDLTPQEDLERKPVSTFVEYTGKRQSKQGRPTKKSRREIGGMLGW